MKGIAAILALVLVMCMAAPTAGAWGDDGEKALSRSGQRLHVFSDAEMDFQILRGFGADTGGGGTIGEILMAAGDIVDGNPVSWSKAFRSLAERLENGVEFVVGNADAAVGHGQQYPAGRVPFPGSRADGHGDAAVIAGIDTATMVWSRAPRKMASIRAINTLRIADLGVSGCLRLVTKKTCGQ